MGWSMKGILTSALGSLGGAAEDWAKRGIAEDAKIRDQERVDAMVEARENRQDALQRARTEAASDYAEAKANRIEERKREEQKTILAEGAAGAAADNLTPGTPAYNRYMGDYLNQQGHSDLGEKYIGHAEKGDEFGLKSELNDYKMTHGGGRGGGGGGGGGGAREAAASSKQQELDMKRIERMAGYQLVQDPNNPDKTIKVPNVEAADVLTDVYARTKGNMDVVREASMAGFRAVKENPKADFTTEVGKYVQQKVDTRLADRARDSGVLPVKDFGQGSGGVPAPEVPSLPMTGGSQFRDPLRVAKAPEKPGVLDDELNGSVLPNQIYGFQPIMPLLNRIPETPASLRRKAYEQRQK